MLFRSDRKSTRLNSSHTLISYAVFCLKKKNRRYHTRQTCASTTSPSHGNAGLLMVGRLKSPKFFFFKNPATTEISTLPLHDALPICRAPRAAAPLPGRPRRVEGTPSSVAPEIGRATSELQSHSHLVCRLPLEKT